MEITGEFKTSTEKDHGPLVRIQGIGSIGWKFNVGEAFFYRIVWQVLKRPTATVDVVEQAFKCKH